MRRLTIPVEIEVHDDGERCGDECPLSDVLDHCNAFGYLRVRGSYSMRAEACIRAEQPPTREGE
jgi:hypothetical protein